MTTVLSGVDTAEAADLEAPPPSEGAVRRSPRIGQLDVFSAADALILAGHRPTIDRVRVRLGRGSPNTINEHLDAWWLKLGARLRDIPGGEFPQLPARTSQALLGLWNEALEGAREVLQGSMATRESGLAAREQALQALSDDRAQRETALASRAAGFEESLALAKSQLSVANQRAERLEEALHKRDSECARYRGLAEAAEAKAESLRTQLDAVIVTHQAEREKLATRSNARENRWLTEIDRVRQVGKDLERDLRELGKQLKKVESERDLLRQEAQTRRSELKTALAVREQLELRLKAAIAGSKARARRGSSKARKSASKRNKKPVQPSTLANPPDAG